MSHRAKSHHSRTASPVVPRPTLPDLPITAVSLLHRWCFEEALPEADNAFNQFLDVT